MSKRHFCNFELAVCAHYNCITDKIGFHNVYNLTLELRFSHIKINTILMLTSQLSL